MYLKVILLYIKLITGIYSIKIHFTTTNKVENDKINGKLILVKERKLKVCYNNSQHRVEVV